MLMLFVSLIITGWLSVFVSFWVFYIMYVHFLDAQVFEDNLLFVDVEEAKRFIYSPDILKTCLETFQSTCSEQVFFNMKHHEHFFVCNLLMYHVFDIFVLLCF